MATALSTDPPPPPLASVDHEKETRFSGRRLDDIVDKRMTKNLSTRRILLV